MDSVTDAPDITLPIHNLKNVKALAYDPYEHHIYWIDGRTHSIKKSLINGTGTAIVVPNPHDMNKPFDLELDPYSRLIYWSCSHSNSINITRLDGKSVGALLSDSQDRPRTIALHHKKGYILQIYGNNSLLYLILIDLCFMSDIYFGSMLSFLLRLREYLFII